MTCRKYGMTFSEYKLKWNDEFQCCTGRRVEYDWKSHMERRLPVRRLSGVMRMVALCVDGMIRRPRKPSLHLLYPLRPPEPMVKLQLGPEKGC